MIKTSNRNILHVLDRQDTVEGNPKPNIEYVRNDQETLLHTSENDKG